MAKKSGKTTKVGRGADQFVLRFPKGMRDFLKFAAEKNGRSMNTEIVARLENSEELSRQLATMTIRRDEALSTVTTLVSIIAQSTFGGDSQGKETLSKIIQKLDGSPDALVEKAARETLEGRDPPA
jgi:hypothetical protein